MTQLFSSHGSTTLPVEKKRAFSGIPLSTNSQPGNNQVSQKIKNFFRINSLGSDSKKEEKEDGKHHKHSHNASADSQTAPKSETEKKSTFRQSRFIPHINRNRSTTVASEGNPLDDGLSPTANANPYFVHQGPPAIRHHNEGSVPPSPPDTPQILATKAEAVNGANDQATTAGKEELARKLRRVASAPNAQALFNKSKSAPGDRPSTAELGKEPLVQDTAASTLTLVDNVQPGSHLVPVSAGENGVTPGMTPGQIRQAVAPVAFRRTYSSNSIKVRDVEVGPGSFDKIKLIGKGDVGKVYLVREKKSSRLYAMKGESKMFIVAAISSPYNWSFYY